MSFLRRLFGLPCSSTSSKAPRHIVVDATSFVMPDNKGRSNNFQPNPRDHFNVLRFLADFAEREQLEITAVFTGRPLREAPDGKPFKNVIAYYAEKPEAMEDRILGLVKRFGPSETMVVTMSSTLEKKAMSLGATCMRTSTLRKTFEEKERQPQQNRRRPRNDNPSQNATEDEPENDNDSDENADDEPITRDSREPQSRDQREQREPRNHNSRDREQRRNVLDLIDPI